MPDPSAFASREEFLEACISSIALRVGPPMSLSGIDGMFFAPSHLAPYCGRTSR